jgi:hypothetical protein
MAEWQRQLEEIFEGIGKNYRIGDPTAWPPGGAET